MEPGPVRDTVYPLAFRYCCSALTSVPVEPRVRDLVKVVVVMVVGIVVVFVVGHTVSGTLVFSAVLYLFTDACVRGP